MKFQELLDQCSLKAAGKEIGLDVRVVEGQLVCTPFDPDDPRYSVDFIFPSMKMVEACRADDFDFFQPFINAGKLTIEHMHHAAQRYHLGKTKSGSPIFWMIDDMLDPLDARIMQSYSSDTWVSQLLKKREPLIQYWHHCLFGLHLLNSDFCDKSISNTNLTNSTNNPSIKSRTNDLSDSCDSCSGENISAESMSSVVVKNNSLDSCDSCSEENISDESMSSVVLKTNSLDSCDSCSGENISDESMSSVVVKTNSLDSCNSCSGENISAESMSSVVVKTNSLDSCNSCSENKPISIVESEASAVILSELFPESLWMAYVSTTHLSYDLFVPLQGRNVTIYPRTDPYLSNYLFFDDFIASVLKGLDIHISVSSILEDYATDEQKSRCIDLIDFLLEEQ